MGRFGKSCKTEHLKTLARTLYDFEMECRRQGWGDPAFVYDEEHDLFRWTDARFAILCEHADWALLRKRGRLRGWEQSVAQARTLAPQDTTHRDQSHAHEQHGT